MNMEAENVSGSQPQPLSEPGLKRAEANLAKIKLGSSVKRVLKNLGEQWNDFKNFRTLTGKVAPGTIQEASKGLRDGLEKGHKILKRFEAIEGHILSGNCSEDDRKNLEEELKALKEMIEAHPLKEGEKISTVQGLFDQVKNNLSIKEDVTKKDVNKHFENLKKSMEGVSEKYEELTESLNKKHTDLEKMLKEPYVTACRNAKEITEKSGKSGKYLQADELLNLVLKCKQIQAAIPEAGQNRPFQEMNGKLQKAKESIEKNIKNKYAKNKKKYDQAYGLSSALLFKGQSAKEKLEKLQKLNNSKDDIRHMLCFKMTERIFKSKYEQDLFLLYESYKQNVSEDNDKLKRIVDEFCKNKPVIKSTDARIEDETFQNAESPYYHLPVFYENKNSENISNNDDPKIGDNR